MAQRHALHVERTAEKALMLSEWGTPVGPRHTPLSLFRTVTVWQGRDPLLLKETVWKTKLLEEKCTKNEITEYKIFFWKIS